MVNFFFDFNYFSPSSTIPPTPLSLPVSWSFPTPLRQISAIFPLYNWINTSYSVGRGKIR